MLFVKEEAELATDPIFSPCAFKEKRRQISKKEDRIKLSKKRLVDGNIPYIHREEGNECVETMGKERKICSCC